MVSRAQIDNMTPIRHAIHFALGGDPNNPIQHTKHNTSNHIQNVEHIMAFAAVSEHFLIITASGYQIAACQGP